MIARRLNKAGLDHVVYAPLRFFLRHQAWRRNVSGAVKGTLPFFWGILDPIKQVVDFGTLDLTYLA